MIANIASNDALILSHRANPAGLNFRERHVCLAQIMATNDTAINIIDGLKGQHAQLRRLLAQRMWINEASKATLAELENQIAQIKTVLLELEKEIQDQLKRVQ
jgi:hypothetical protein